MRMENSDLTLMAWPTLLVPGLLTAQARFFTEPNLSGHSPACKVRGTDNLAASITPAAMGSSSDDRGKLPSSPATSRPRTPTGSEAARWRYLASPRSNTSRY